MTPDGSRFRLPVGATLADAFRLYRLLFARSVFVAAIVYAVIALAEVAHRNATGAGASLLALAISLLTLAGPALVQGALVEVVRNVHEGRRPDPVTALFGKARDRILPLIGASFVYALGVLAGLVLFIVPGILALTRWSLMAPVVVLERRRIQDARRRSSALVVGNGPAVFTCLLVAFLLIDVVSLGLVLGRLGFGARTFGTFLWSSLTAPFAAHVLTALYYRLSDSERPVVHPAVRTWSSLWDGR